MAQASACATFPVGVLTNRHKTECPLKFITSILKKQHQFITETTSEKNVIVQHVFRINCNFGSIIYELVASLRIQASLKTQI